ncbi:phosphotransferase [Cytobacillus oceanisediminis]|uniref:Phosphotransferase family enzyme n=1 Tax=Cytobacillus oceanisediminis TaxID=665099 RepID=A0A562JB59_9BACI|nr:phosphotransferase family enzyme [Cytobacillus oceanisediminis]
MECQEISMKAVNTTVKNGGDDLFKNRLLSYLKEQFPFKIDDIKPIRKQVYLVSAQERVFILKGFSSYHRLKLQEAFTASLINEGFAKTYAFYEFAKEPPLFYDRTYYGCLEYIHPSEDSFSYHLKRDRLEGLELLQAFHDTSEKVVSRYQTVVPAFKQAEKWRERASLFLNNLPVIRYFVQKEIINELLSWADWSLKGIEEEAWLFQSGRQVILHGDVAHHNFLRAKNKTLYLLDFDLIAKATPHSDYLQYANRILPYMKWSFDDLLRFPIIKQYMEEKGFIYALAFPTDIFREWNRVIRERSYLDPVKIRPVLDLTVGQFAERQRFIRALKKAAED